MSLGPDLNLYALVICLLCCDCARLLLFPPMLLLYVCLMCCVVCVFEKQTHTQTHTDTLTDTQATNNTIHNNIKQHQTHNTTTA